MTVETIYDIWANQYDQDTNKTRDLDEVVTRRLLTDLTRLRVLEIGCGTGKNTGFLARSASSVLALDFSASMLEKARQKISASNVTFHQADLTRAWPVADNSVDLLVCNLVLEHIENLNGIMAEAARVLIPAGRFLICELHPFWQYEGKKANFETVDGRFEIPAHIHHVSDFLTAARNHRLALVDLNEWWHPDDHNRPPRLLSLLLQLATGD